MCEDLHIKIPVTIKQKHFSDQKLFEHNRAIQIEAVKKIVTANLKYDRKYQLIKAMLENIFSVILQNY